MAIARGFSPEELAERQTQEVNELLKLAEEFQDKLDKARSLALANYFATIFALASGVFTVFLVLSLSGSKYHTWFEYAITVAVASGCVGVGAYSYSQLLRLTANQRRDSRALREVIGILRETELVMSKAQGWSGLQRAMFRIRLSRFDVGRASSEHTRHGNVDAEFEMVSPNLDREP